jgi:GNAT superfamily N-acetyltransferase
VPVGQIGAEDKGDYVELRRMYVQMEYRRCGIGTILVQSLINHCLTQKVGSIELWTAEHGLGRILYEKFGFQKAERVGEALDSSDQIRMRLALTD